MGHESQGQEGISNNTFTPGPTENKWVHRTKSTLRLWKKQATEILKEGGGETSTKTVSQGRGRGCCIESQGAHYWRALQVEESHPWPSLHFPQPPGSSFQGSVVIRLPLRQAVDSVAFLAAKLLGAVQAHPAKQASTGFHHAQASASWKMKMAKRVLMSC